MMRMQSRPKVMLATNFEEAMDIFDRYESSLSGVICDLGFFKEGVHNSQAGLQLAAHMRENAPELPILMQSAQPEDSQHADTARAFGLQYVCKKSPALLERSHVLSACIRPLP